MTPATSAKTSAEANRVVRRLVLRSATTVARASAAAISAARARSVTELRNDASSRASTPACRGRTSRDRSRQRRTSRTSSSSAPHALRLAKAAPSLPEAASSRIWERLPTYGARPVKISKRIAPSGEDISLLVQPLDFSPRLLWAHVCRGANDGPRLRRLGPSRCADCRDWRLDGSVALAREPVRFNTLSKYFREAPIDYLHFAEGADHDVRGLEVAVDDPRE